jgi:hypothetical protein
VRVNRLPNVPAYRKASLASKIGPRTRKASWAAGPNCTKEAATKASDSEQSDRTTARAMSATMLNTGVLATEPSTDCGTKVWRAAATAAPMIR